MRAPSGLEQPLGPGSHRLTGWRLVETDIIGTFEAKIHLSSPLERVAKGEKFATTKHGEPVAQLLAMDQRNPEQIKAVVRRMEDRVGDLTLEDNWKEFRDAGRKP